MCICLRMHANLKPMTPTNQVIIRRCCKDYMTPAAPVKSSTDFWRKPKPCVIICVCWGWWQLMRMRRGNQELLNQVVILNLNILSKSLRGIFSPTLMHIWCWNICNCKHRQNRDDEKYLPKCPNSTHVARATNPNKSKLLPEEFTSLCKTHYWLFMEPHLSSLAKPSELPCCLPSTWAADLQYQQHPERNRTSQGLYSTVQKFWNCIFMKEECINLIKSDSYDFYFGYKILYFK